MSLDLATLGAAVDLHGRVARIVITAQAGSTPRDIGVSMLVWGNGQSGTIGGGTLEHEAIARARLALGQGDRLDKIALGPSIGQCCGGAVTLLTEIWDHARLGAAKGQLARPMPGAGPDMPLKVANRLRQARNGQTPLRFEVVQGWIIEPLTPPRHPVWIWGAGHVGRAMVSVLSPLPDLALTWIDTGADRFPSDIPQGVDVLTAKNPADLVARSPKTARHLIVTFSHALDLELCHRLLPHGFVDCGLIGSATKWARFQSRLAALGHQRSEINRITCPIGDPALGKHPQAIAISVAARLLIKQPIAQKIAVAQGGSQ